MAKELKTPFISGATVYAVILNAAGQAWRSDTAVFEPPAAGDWAHYANATTEQSTTGIYEGNFPVAITTAGAYHLLFRQQSGSSPASTDQSNGMIGGTIYWTGSAESFPLASSTASAASVAMSGGNVNVNIAQWNGTAVSLFKPSFNQSYEVEDSPTGWWVTPYHFGIDQGPIILMIENYRTGLIWKLMRRSPYIVVGLKRAGFEGGWLED